MVTVSKLVPVYGNSEWYKSCKFMVIVNKLMVYGINNFMVPISLCYK